MGKSSSFIWGNISAMFDDTKGFEGSPSNWTFHATSFSRISWISRSAASSMDMVAKGCGHLKTSQVGMIRPFMSRWWFIVGFTTLLIYIGVRIYREGERQMHLHLYWFLHSLLFIRHVRRSSYSYWESSCKDSWPGQGAISRYSLCSSDLSWDLLKGPHHGS